MRYRGKRHHLARRKGSVLMLVLMLAVTAGALVSQLRLAKQLGYGTASDAQAYSTFQTRRSAADLAVLQFIRDLQTFNLVRSEDTEWVEVKGSAVYSQALGILQESVTDASKVRWTCKKLSDLVTALGLQDPEAITLIESAVGSEHSEIDLTLLSDLEFDWEAKESYVSKKESSIVLKPVHILFTIKAGSEVSLLYYTVSSLTLNAVVESTSNSVYYSIGGVPCLERE